MDDDGEPQLSRHSWEDGSTVTSHSWQSAKISPSELSSIFEEPERSWKESKQDIPRHNLLFDDLNELSHLPSGSLHNILNIDGNKSSDLHTPGKLSASLESIDLMDEVNAIIRNASLGVDVTPAFDVGNINTTHKNSGPLININSCKEVTSLNPTPLLMDMGDSPESDKIHLDAININKYHPETLASRTTTPDKSLHCNSLSTAMVAPCFGVLTLAAKACDVSKIRTIELTNSTRNQSVISGANVLRVNTKNSNDPNLITSNVDICTSNAPNSYTSHTNATSPNSNTYKSCYFNLETTNSKPNSSTHNLGRTPISGTHNLCITPNCSTHNLGITSTHLQGQVRCTCVITKIIYFKLRSCNLKHIYSLSR